MRNQPNVTVPKRYDTLEPLLEGLRQLGGSAPKSDVVDKVAELLQLTDEQRNVLTNRGQPVFDDELSWARWILDKSGLIDGSQRGIWQLTDKGWATKTIDKDQIIATKERYLQEQRQTKRAGKSTAQKARSQAPPDTPDWKSDLIARMRTLTPYQFELMSRNLLQKLGLKDVKVTQKSNDGGIDGYGIVKIAGIVGFKMAFQCKRYQGSISPKDIQAFRGAVTDKVEKYLFITTGTFTAQAKREAERLFIDLLDGDELAERMADAKAGVKNQLVVDETYFRKFRDE